MSGYIGNIPTPQATQTRDTFTATSGQTSFATSGYTPNFLDVYLNGVHLVNGTDYTASNGSDVVLTTGATTGDNLEVVAYTTFQVVDQSFRGNFSVDTDTLFVDAANNRVGVGTSSPAVQLDVFGNSAAVQVSEPGGAAARIVAGGSSAFLGTYSNHPLLFLTNSAESARIDASGNLLVGKTSSGVVTIGAELRDGTTGNYAVTATAAGQAPILANRTTSDGELIHFRKDNTTVGSIGTLFGDLYVATGNTGIRCVDANRSVSPYDSDANALVDAAVDLGFATARYKDLYLSGGVYLGGTGSANLLDDYEEGTWTPSLTDGTNTISLGTAQYTKIGRIVQVHINAYNSGAFASLNTSGNLQILGFPFPGLGGATCFGTNNPANINLLVDINGSSTYLWNGNGSVDFTPCNKNTIGLGSGTASMRGIIVYYTNS
jgi:hypothetical protein